MAKPLRAHDAGCSLEPRGVGARFSASEARPREWGLDRMAVRQDAVNTWPDEDTRHPEAATRRVHRPKLTVLTQPVRTAAKLFASMSTRWRALAIAAQPIAHELEYNAKLVAELESGKLPIAEIASRLRFYAWSDRSRAQLQLRQADSLLWLSIHRAYDDLELTAVRSVWPPPSEHLRDLAEQLRTTK
jgi:hypothetical protein